MGHGREREREAPSLNPGKPPRPESHPRFVWMLLLGYFGTKGAVMTLINLVRAHAFEQQAAPASKVRFVGDCVPVRSLSCLCVCLVSRFACTHPCSTHPTPPHHPKPKPKPQTDGAAFCRWQEARARRERALTLSCIETAVCGGLLTAMVMAAGGVERVQMEMETVNEGALCRLTVGMWLFWVSSDAGVGRCGFWVVWFLGCRTGGTEVAGLEGSGRMAAGGC